MAFAITQTCCSDASCVTVCPVNCIHPTPDEPDFGTTDMLYIDPHTCIDCGACADACPVDAIFPLDQLSGQLRDYAELNAAYYAEAEQAPAAAETGPNFHRWGAPVFDRSIPSDFGGLDVAVIGTGPAGMYAAEDLLLHTNSTVTLIDRLPAAGGLVRFGVAPDHLATKRIGETFARLHEHPRVRMRLGVEVGTDVTAEDLAREHDAVIYAVGASSARELGIPGEDLPGSLAATTAVAWYNGHPDVSPGAVDPSSERVVIVGNGNVALDVARILTTDPDELADTPISPDALARLRTGKVREVVLLGRRGPDAAAYTKPELRALIQRDDVDLVVDAHHPRVSEAIESAVPGGKAALLREIPREAVDLSAPPPDRRRIVLRFHSAPHEFLGDVQLRGLRVTGSTGDVDISAGQVVRAIGYRARPLPGLPFDEATATIPNSGGRVDDLPGSYVVGWVKRGPSGGIGTNRECARETIGTLLDDAIAGRLRTTGKRRKGLFPRLRVGARA